MQILPANNAIDNFFTEVGHTSTGTDAGDAFSSLLDMQSDSSISEADSGDYERASAVTGHAAADEKITPDEYAELRSSLKEMGVDDSKLDELEERVGQGMTWREMATEMAMLASGTGKAMNVSAQERAQLTSLLKKLGFHPSQAESLVHSLGKGELKAVLSAIKSKLDSLPAGTKLQLNSQELQTLGKYLQLTDKGMSSLQAFANGMQPGGVSASDFRDLLAMISSETAKGVDVAGNIQTVNDLMAQMLQKADEKALGLSKSDRLAQDDNDKWMAAKKDDWTTDAAQERFKDAESAGDEGEADPDAEGKELLGDLLKKGVDAKAEREFLGLVAERAPNLKESMENAMQAEVKSQASTLSKESQQAVFQQVRNAMLRTASDNVQQMTLELNPRELGTVQVALAARDNELAGVIRADSHEAAKAIAERLPELRAALEQQGLKVSNLEVQTRLSGDANGSNLWAGSDGHNFMQDMQSKQRSARLAALRNKTGKADSMAQTVAAAQEARAAVADGRLSVIA